MDNDYTLCMIRKADPSDTEKFSLCWRIELRHF